jgi:hypothetical protein
MELRRKMEEMNGAEKKKQDALAIRNKRLQEENAAKRAAAEERLRKNFEMAKMVEEKRKNDFLETQRLFEESRNRHLAQLEQERQLHSQEVCLKKSYHGIGYFLNLNDSHLSYYHISADSTPRTTPSYATHPISA